MRNLVGRGQGHITELDGLRGIACLAILISHCIGGALDTSVMAWPQVLWEKLYYFLLGGVDLFFVLSGLLIGGILIDNRGAPNYFAAFWTRRAGRILPVLFIVVATYSILPLVRPYIDAPFLDLYLLKEPHNSPLWYLSFTQTIPMAQSGWGPQWLAVTWSLAIEEQFYLFFPFLVYLMPPRRLAIVMMAFVVLAAASRGLIQHYVEWSVSYILLPCRMDCLSLGVLIAIAVRNVGVLARLREYRRVLDVAILVLAVMLSSRQFDIWKVLVRPFGALASDMVFTLVYTAVALFFALCVLRVFLYPNGAYRRFLSWRPLTWIGLISYGLYMYHQPVNGLVHGLLFGTAPRVDSSQELAAAVVVMLIATSLAALSFYLVETPIRRAAQRINFTRPVDSVVRARMSSTAVAN